MKIATWNVNSIRARKDRVIAWVAEHQPDVLCLQELKVEASGFPIAPLAALGYEAVIAGQRSYNGVGILSRERLENVTAGLDDGHDDTQARLIAGTFRGVRVLCTYMPNGNAVPSDKFDYKLKWMERFRAYLDRHHKPDEKLVLLGDMNVAPHPIDVFDPAGWTNEPIFHVDAQKGLANIAAFGLVDVVRQHHPEGAYYTYWDFRDLAYPKNNGLRIDHILATAPLAKLCTSADVDRNSRIGNTPSDHAALVAHFEI